MANRFCVSLTHAKDNQDKATVGFVVANAAVGSGKETLVFLSVEGVRLAQKGYADEIREEGFAPLRELIQVVLVELALLEARRADVDRATRLREVFDQLPQRSEPFLTDLVGVALLGEPDALDAQKDERLLA